MKTISIPLATVSLLIMATCVFANAKTVNNNSGDKVGQTQSSTSAINPVMIINGEAIEVKKNPTTSKTCPALSVKECDKNYHCKIDKDRCVPK